MARLVQKFGGTSVADVQCIRNAAQIAVSAAEEGHEVATVVSAMGQTTDHLIDLARQMNEQPDARELDMLLATGEQQSIALMSMAIQSLGGQARSFTGAQAGIVTESRHGQARILDVKAQAVEACLTKGEIAVVAGFQGVSEKNELTTLGRGGSDTTAVALAGAIGAERCDIYTDVAGVYTADPRLLPDARRLSSVSYDEMLELAIAGAEVLNPRSVEMAMDLHLPVRVRSTFKPDDLGTLITHRLVAPEYSVCGIACDMSQASLVVSMTVPANDILAGVSGLFTRLNELEIGTDMVMLLAREDEPTQELAFSVDQSYLSRVRSVLDSFSKSLGNPKISVDTDIARISVIGRGMSSRPAIVAGIFDTLSSANIAVQMVAIGDIKVSALVPAKHARKAVKMIHKRLDLGRMDIR